jgi:hypothetical protein
MAALPQASVLPRRLRHLQLASVPPPIALALLRQAMGACDQAHASAGSRATCVPRQCFSPRRGGNIPLAIGLPQLLQTGRPEAAASDTPCNALLPHPERPVLTAPCRATPGCAPRRQAAAAGDAGRPRGVCRVVRRKGRRLIPYSKGSSPPPHFLPLESPRHFWRRWLSFK